MSDTVGLHTPDSLSLDYYAQCRNYDLISIFTAFSYSAIACISVFTAAILISWKTTSSVDLVGECTNEKPIPDNME
jgi:hypothetical protein